MESNRPPWARLQGPSIGPRALACVGVAAAIFGWSAAMAQALPQGPLTLVVPYPPGGVSDVLARGFAPAFGHLVDRPIIVENLSGASGSIAATRFLGAVPNGSQILVGSPTETVLAPLTIKSLKYRAADFRLLGVLYSAPVALYVRPDLDARTVDDLADPARRAGKPLNYGSPGSGSLYHIVTEKLRSTMAIEAVHVPYRGGAPMLQDLMAGTIDFTMLPQDNVLGALVDTGKLRMLGVAADHRSARRPDVPTFDESARAKGIGRPSVWVGLFVPRTMPPQLVAQLHQTIVQALGQPQTRLALEATGGAVPAAMGLPEAEAFYAREMRILQDLAKAADVQPN
ncbi:tripartite tricarboxylate transporter substrate binding protein [Variovorax sp. KK3]|uniref:Bug family tripartite tricarboxylate transporter substrate binding protein n=1 Tax=Variovorax sp. KK3 TaxID=1855728 RepID=UPI0015C3609D|nr:tripartite tricarboxylate transporter substrate binding protein [Variovorax sp. KK3]